MNTPMISVKTREFFPLRMEDFREAVVGLTHEEAFAFLLLLMKAWELGGSLPDRDGSLAIITMVTRQKWRHLRPVLEPYFKVKEGRWYHPGLMGELERREALSAKRAAAARARWEGAST